MTFILHALLFILNPSSLFLKLELCYPYFTSCKSHNLLFGLIAMGLAEILQILIGIPAVFAFGFTETNLVQTLNDSFRGVYAVTAFSNSRFLTYPYVSFKIKYTLLVLLIA